MTRTEAKLAGLLVTYRHRRLLPAEELQLGDTFYVGPDYYGAVHGPFLATHVSYTNVMGDPTLTNLGEFPIVAERYSILLLVDDDDCH